MDQNVKIIFLGTPRFAARTLDMLVEAGFNVVGVVTPPDKPAGRKQQLKKSPVKVAAEKHGIKLVKMDELAEMKPDLGILFAYGKIIPQSVLNLFPRGILNIHPSLLPQYRGATPVPAAILNGDEKTGISIIKLTNKMDQGPVVAQQEVEILKDETAEKLLSRLAEIGSRLLIKILPDYLTGRIKLQPQDERAASYTKPIKRQDGQINWQRSAKEIERQFRAFYPWPGVFTYWRGKRLKIVKLSQFEGDFKQNLTPGTVFLAKNGQLAVACRDGAVMLEIVQLAGKKEMSGKEFVNGYQEIAGQKLG